MSSTTASAPAAFRHEALLYEGEAAFVDATVPFLANGVEGDEALLVVVNARKIDLLKSQLGPDADSIAFADMDDVGLNPARIIPAWRAFVDENSARGRPMRGIGEPIWPARGLAELTECHHHEALLNVAFTNAKKFWLLCPYDTQTLGSEVIDRVAHTHPFLRTGEGSSPSEVYDYDTSMSQPFLEPLPDPPVEASTISFSAGSLKVLRRWIADLANSAGLSREKGTDFVLAVDEIASNSIRHGGGQGTARAWEEAGAVVCDVFSGGHIRQPLAGRQLPGPGHSGRGLWLANQLCDLVQIRSSAAGTLVRLRQSTTVPADV